MPDTVFLHFLCLHTRRKKREEKGREEERAFREESRVSPIAT
jgi:hypothetical protein